ADVLLFCNWLSACEDRRACYRRDDKVASGWACDFTADGYRLPSDAEWEYANRAGSAGRYFFGEDVRWLPLYGHVAHQVTLPCGSKLPNRWGLFDVVGNVWEVTGDRLAWLPAGEKVYLTTFLLAGGGYDSGSNDCCAIIRAEGRPELQNKVGFRVVCASQACTREPVSDPTDGRVVLAYLVRSAGADGVQIGRRADLHGRYSDWRAASADYRWLVERSGPHVEFWTTYAALLVQTGDEAAYRSMRRRLLDQFGTSADPLECERVAKACLLVEGADLDRVLRMLVTALRNDAPPWAVPYAELARGMAEYRRGEHAAAVRWLEQCDPRDQPLSDECRALRGFFLAMAYHRLGRRDDAARTFEQARTLR